jgi:16S rRNA C967 or C1407 C5-methylase (RsmB/RsmF family)
MDSAGHMTQMVQDFLDVDPLDRKWRTVQAVLLDPSCSGSGTAATRMDFLTSHNQDIIYGSPLDGDGSASCGGPTTNTILSDTHTMFCHRDSTVGAKDKVESERGAHLSPLVSGMQLQAGSTCEDSSFPGVTSASSSKRVRALAAFQATIIKHALRFPNLERLVYSTCSVYREENEDVVAAVLPHAAAMGLSLGTALPQWPRRGLHGSYDWADKVVRVHPELDGTDGFFAALFVRESGIGQDTWPAVLQKAGKEGETRRKGRRRKMEQRSATHD